MLVFFKLRESSVQSAHLARRAWSTAPHELHVSAHPRAAPLIGFSRVDEAITLNATAALERNQGISGN